MMQTFKNTLLISGSGRNVGKTSFILNVIEQNISQKLAAIKITPHFHEPTPGLIAIEVNENFRVFQETNRDSEKDSSLFLRSGAEKVLYIQTSDLFLNEAFLIALAQLEPDQPVVTESAAFRKFIVPGLYLFIQKLDLEVKPSAIEMKKLADHIIISDGNSFSITPKSIRFDQTWQTTTL